MEEVLHPPFDFSIAACECIVMAMTLQRVRDDSFSSTDFFVCKEFLVSFLPTRRRRAISKETHSAAALMNNNNNNNNFDDDDHQQRSQPTSSLTWPRFMTG